MSLDSRLGAILPGQRIKKRHAQRTFIGREHAASPGAGETARSRYAFAPVVRGEDEDGVFFQPQLVDRAQKLAHVGIRLRQQVGEGTVPGLALEIGVRVGRIMGLRVGEESEERLLGLGLALDEVDRMVGDFAIDRGALGAVVHLQFPGLLTSLPRHDVGQHGTGVCALLENGAVRPVGPVRRPGDSVPLIESLVGGIPALGVSQVPFPEDPRGVADIRQHLRQRVLVFGDAVPDVAGRSVLLQPGANPVTTGHQGRTRRYTFRFDVVVRQAKTLVGEAVDAGRRRLLAGRRRHRRRPRHSRKLSISTRTMFGLSGLPPAAKVGKAKATLAMRRTAGFMARLIVDIVALLCTGVRITLARFI